jgi:predicted nucleic acid-binding protein
VWGKPRGGSSPLIRIAKPGDQRARFAPKPSNREELTIEYRRPDRGFIERDEEGGVTVHAPSARLWVGPGPEPLRVEAYLDTCVVSALTKADLGPVQQEALFELLQAYKSRRLALVTSRVAHEEIQKIPAEVRAQHEVIYALLEDVPAKQESGEKGAVFSQLRAILPDADDARHVFQALTNGVDYFVTADTRTIVSRRSEIEARYSIKVRLPSELVDELAL